MALARGMNAFVFYYIEENKENFCVQVRLE